MTTPSVISLGDDKYTFNISNLEFILDNEIVDNITIVFRLLTIDELKLVEKFSPSQDRDSVVNISAILAQLEDDIFNRCVFHVYGTSKDIKQYIDEIEAGIVSTIANVIIKKSTDLLIRLDYWLETYKSNSSILDQIELLVCRNYNMPLSEVKEMALDTLLRRYSVIAGLFPQEELKKAEAPKEDD